MDRDLAEHLAKDTGLRPDDIAADIEPSTEGEIAEHLASDTGVDAAELDADVLEPVDQIVGRLPID